MAKTPTSQGDWPRLILKVSMVTIAGTSRPHQHVRPMQLMLDLRIYLCQG